MTTITIDTAAAELLDFALDLLYAGVVQTLEEGEREASLLLDDVQRYGAEWDAYAAELEAQR
jgi:hypothetical protein